MRVLLTGATGFIGSHLVPELLGAGHEVTGLSRSAEGAAVLERAGARVARGDVNDLDRLRELAAAADGVVHAAFQHDFGNVAQHSEADRLVIAALGAALAGSGRPLVVSSGTGLVRRPADGAPVTESDPHAPVEQAPRAATEEATEALAGQGLRVVVVRLAQVHDTTHAGRLGEHVKLAREKGWVAYVGDGANRLPGVHVSDAVHLYRLALEHGRDGARYHAVAEEGVPMRDIAATIGTRLGLPVRSVTAAEAGGYFGPLTGLAALDLAASSAATRKELDWTPTGPGLLEDLAAETA